MNGVQEKRKLASLDQAPGGAFQTGIHRPYAFRYLRSHLTSYSSIFPANQAICVKTALAYIVNSRCTENGTFEVQHGYSSIAQLAERRAVNSCQSLVRAQVGELASASRHLESIRTVRSPAGIRVRGVSLQWVQLPRSPLELTDTHEFAREGWQRGNASASKAVARVRALRGFDPLALRFPWDGDSGLTGARRRRASRLRIPSSRMRSQWRDAWLPTRSWRVRTPSSALSHRWWPTRV